MRQIVVRLLALVTLVYLIACAAGDSASPHLRTASMDPDSPCQLVLGDEDALMMWTMCYDEQQQAAFGRIPGRAFQCNVGKLHLQDKAAFSILLKCGQGPGEIQNLVNSIQFTEGNLYVRDIVPRIQVFDQEGNYLRTLHGNHTRPGLKPYQLYFHVSGSTMWAAGVEDRKNVIVTKYQITEKDDLVLEKDIVVITDWPEMVETEFPPTHFVWMGEETLFMGSPLWGKYILVDIHSGKYRYEDIVLSSRQARTLPNRTIANFNSAFLLDGHIALLENIQEPVHFKDHTIDLHYAVTIQQPETNSVMVFDPVEAGFISHVFSVVGLGAVATGPRSFLVFEVVKTVPEGDPDFRYMHYHLE